MNAFLLLLQLTLAAVFAVAAVAKWFSPDKTRATLASFGVPDWLLPACTVLLPLAETLTAILILPLVAPRTGALVALLLLAVFTVAIAWQLARGRVVDCACFGEIASRPIGRHTLVRNSLLLAAAALLVWRGPGTAGEQIALWLAQRPTTDLVGLAFSVNLLCIVGGACLAYRLRTQAHRIDALERRLASMPPAAGLPVGAFAPGFTLPAIGGREHSLDALLAAKKPLVLVFVHPDCGPCSMLLPKIVDWRARLGHKLAFALLTTSSSRGNAPAEYQVLDTLLEQNRAVSKGYQASSIPSAVLIRPDGTIGSPLAAGPVAIGKLIEGAANW